MAVTLPPNRLQRREHYSQHYAVALPGDVSLEQALLPEYFAHIGERLQQFDRIDFMAENGSYLAETVVTAAGRGFAKLKLLALHDLAEAAAEATKAEDEAAITTVVWRGIHHKWCVERNSDNERLKDGFLKKEEAQAWARDYAKITS